MIEYFLIFLTVVLLYAYLVKPYSYWENKSIPCVKGYPPFGSMNKFSFSLESMVDFLTNTYNSNNYSRYLGIYFVRQPTLLIKDLDLIKKIAVKDFDNFVDHQSMITEENDPIFGKNLFSVTGTKWRYMRSTLSPAFTGSKLRSMFALISEIAQQFALHYEKHASDGRPISLEMKDSVTRFANDVVATTAFGVKVDTLADRNCEFYRHGRSASSFAGLKTLIILGYLILPKLMAVLKIPFFSKKESTFFRNLVMDTMKMREERNIVRPDMIHLLMQARKGQLKYDDERDEDTAFAAVKESNIEKETRPNMELDDDDCVAQAMLFFIAGFDTISTAISTMAYELALNTDVQERLIEEIDKARESGKGTFPYDLVIKMKYMDMVLSETLRKWPPIEVTDRCCNAKYVIEPEGPSEEPTILKKGDVVWIPIHPIHRDPQYYPDPDKFDPERFSDENKDNINPLAYLPFGVGPRSCIGSRFALLEAKIFFCYLLSKFEITISEKTPIPLKIKKGTFNLNVENGYWLALKLRK